MLSRILVAFDGSDGSRKALRYAGELARQVGGRLTLVHVLEPLHLAPFEDYGLTLEKVRQTQLQGAHALLEAARQELSGVEVETVISSGAPAEVVCAEAERRGVDLVVAGSRGLGPTGRWLLGSVGDRIVHHCSRPVTVVR